MKSKLIATICLLALGLAAARAQDPKIAVPGLTDKPAAPAANFTDAQLVEEFGWFIGKRVGLTELSFNKEEIDLLIKGISAAAAGKESPFELEKIGPKMDEFMQKKQAAYLSKLKDKNSGANAEFFKKLADNKAVVA